MNFLDKFGCIKRNHRFIITSLWFWFQSPEPRSFGILHPVIAACTTAETLSMCSLARRWSSTECVLDSTISLVSVLASGASMSLRTRRQSLLRWWPEPIFVPSSPSAAYSSPLALVLGLKKWRPSWQVVTLDFIEGLPTSSNYDSILVMVDKFSRYAHFIPLSHPYTALQVATSYMNHVFKLHGMPLALFFDRDKIFTSNVW